MAEPKLKGKSGAQRQRKALATAPELLLRELPEIGMIAEPGQHLREESELPSAADTFYSPVLDWMRSEFAKDKSTQRRGRFVLRCRTNYLSKAIPFELVAIFERGFRDYVRQVIEQRIDSAEFWWTPEIPEHYGEVHFRVIFEPASQDDAQSQLSAKALDQNKEMRLGDKETGKISEKPSNQGGPLPSLEENEEPSRPRKRGRPPRHALGPPIKLEEIAQAKTELSAIQESIVQRMQGLLNSLAGRRGANHEESNEIANRVTQLAKDSGVILTGEGSAGSLRWHGRAFEFRSTGTKQTTLITSVLFPNLTAQARGVSTDADVPSEFADASKAAPIKSQRQK